MRPVVSIPTACSRLPNGHTLITSRYARNVIEIDRTGKKVWEFSSPTGNVLHARAPRPTSMATASISARRAKNRAWRCASRTDPGGGST